MPNTIDLHQLIIYIVSYLTEVGATFGKTKLVKLLYLIDVAFYRRHSQKLTGLEWSFYHYGPYAPTIDKVLDQLHIDIPQEKIITASGHKAFIFKPLKNFDIEFEEQASSSVKIVVDHVLDQWGLEELNPLLSYVYFHTEPMTDAIRGDILDFSKIHLPPSSIEKKVVAVLSDQSKELKERFQRAKINHLKAVGELLIPAPRFDEVFLNSYTKLEEDETTYIRQGLVVIDETTKEMISSQSKSEDSV